ncbi:ribosomal L11 methyltransferase [Chloroherpeton thalassium ATCC 35110]|uniref:Ribosomal protein L11 methyltransferase n=1 Tax=Chloroherpeton thalassium (strain ATCC 35110 / GB-78) TaxID=517418 RepID=B3QUV4_CHLT3|nr:50S ribosomal protein L11 methyltransferase [Chloroherpeton thalassium]ACF14455.1 ribosomal L11 methyltransferase [Chloroherpeton thalassium ATCC 35110]
MTESAKHKKTTIQISAEVLVENFDVAIGLLSLEGIDTFHEDNDILRFYMDAQDWTDEKRESVRGILKSVCGKDVALTEEKVAEKNWNEAWEATLKPIEISERLVIVQREKPYTPKPGQIVIEINPKMSFGTGFHETTRLMLRMIEAVLQPDDVVLDIGTGTGVLAIACRKYGNQHPILAFDNYSWAVENAIENSQVNASEDISFELLDAEETLEEALAREKFTLILANVNRGVIGKIFPKLAPYAKSAQIMVSGILVYDEAWLVKLLESFGCKIVRKATEGEWLCALISKA